MYLEEVEQLPPLNLPLHPDIVHFPEGSKATGRSLFLSIRIESRRLGIIKFPVLYCFAENEAFYGLKLIPNKARLSHIIHVRYGGGYGGGGNSAGAWILNVLEQLNCEVFITDNHHYWQSGDDYALQLYPDIPHESCQLPEPIRKIASHTWSGHGDVTWHKTR